MTPPHPSDRPLIEAHEWAEQNLRTAEIRHRKCQNTLDLTPEAIEAFARRQEILIAHDKFPHQRWYSDEDFCRAYNTAVALKAELDKARGA